MIADYQVVAIMAAILRTADTKAQEAGGSYVVVERASFYVSEARELLAAATKAPSGVRTFQTDLVEDR